MTNQLKKIDDLLKQPISWQPETSLTWSAVVAGEICTLKMNDFPDESMYTLTWRDETIDFNDTPKSWSVPM